MLIGVVSDTHNNLKNIEQIISLFNKEKVDLVIHTGDITNANALKKFSSLNCNLVGVYGNNDRNEIGLSDVAEKQTFKFQNPPYLLTLENKNIAIFHEPDEIASFLDLNHDIDLILHGHTHRYREETINNTLLFNSGESAGMQKDKNAIGLINLLNLEIKRIFF